MKYLINNADDYGYRPDISKAIIDSHLNGVLSSATVLVNLITEEEVQLTKQVPDLGLGLHLNVTSGNPLSENWLKKYGAFSRPHRNEPDQFNREIWTPFFERFETNDIYIEYKAQLDKFKELFGKLPTHLDSHHYHSAFPKAFDAFLRLAGENNLPVRNQVVFEVASKQNPMGNIGHVDEYTQILKSSGIKTTNYFSLHYFNRHDNYLEVIEKEFDKIGDGESIELSYHPGLDETWREKDLMILKDNRFKELLNKLDVKLINYSNIKKGA